MGKEQKKMSLLLSENDRVVIAQVLDLFHEVDKDVARFQELTGIRCPDRCGICCAASEVHTTAIEMLPLAVELWERNESDMWLEKIDNAENPALCVFFKKDPDVPTNGRCTIYGLRPLICRLFGFFTVKDKNDNYVYGGCRIIKEKYPESHKKAVELIAKGMHPSRVTDYSIRIISMGTELSRKMVFINTAARIALEKVGFDIKKEEWRK